MTRAQLQTPVLLPSPTLDQLTALLSSGPLTNTGTGTVIINKRGSCGYGLSKTSPNLVYNYGTITIENSGGMGPEKAGTIDAYVPISGTVRVGSWIDCYTFWLDLAAPGIVPDICRKSQNI